jgi:hypothetical protein
MSAKTATAAAFMNGCVLTLTSLGALDHGRMIRRLGHRCRRPRTRRNGVELRAAGRRRATRAPSRAARRVMSCKGLQVGSIRDGALRSHVRLREENLCRSGRMGVLDDPRLSRAVVLSVNRSRARREIAMTVREGRVPRTWRIHAAAGASWRRVHVVSAVYEGFVRGPTTPDASPDAGATEPAQPVLPGAGLSARSSPPLPRSRKAIRSRAGATVRLKASRAPAAPQGAP